MPIEIRELHIRVAVNPDPGKQGEARPGATSNSGGAADREAVVAACVEQVLQILQAKKER